VIVYADVSKLNIVNPIGGTRSLYPATLECPDCKGSGQVDQHGGLRQKTCWRSRRAWTDQGPSKILGPTPGPAITERRPMQQRLCVRGSDHTQNR